MIIYEDTMSDSVVELSSGDESECEKDIKKTFFKKEHGSKRHLEHPSEFSKKRRIETTHLGSVKDFKICESNGSTSPEKENHEVAFNEFVGVCLELDSSANMKKIIEKKLKKYYSLLVPEYRSSEQFSVFLERKGTEMQRSPSQRFMHLKEVVDELNYHRSDKINAPTDSTMNTTTSDHFVRKLCKAMEIIHRRIKKLEETEVDWEDDNESAYIQVQRYRERLINIHAKLQELEGRASSSSHRKISFSGTQFPKVNRAIEKFVNAKGEFPDYHDIHDLLEKSYKTENIDISAGKLKSEAKKVFLNVGEQLQKLRRNEFWETHRHYLDEENDPADTNRDLRTILDANKIRFQNSIDEVINSFAEKNTKAQFASEDSNSPEGVVKEEVKAEDSHGDKEGNDEEVNDKGNNNDNGNDNDDSDNDSDDDEDDEENENVGETMDDILNDIEKEEPEDTLCSDDAIFLYCAPVSPPTTVEDTNSDVLSRSQSPNIITIEESNEEAQVSGEISIVECSEVNPLPGCSKWYNSEKEEEKSNIRKEEETSEKTKVQENKLSDKSKTFIKVRSLASLQTQDRQSVPEEILLD